MDKRDKGYTLYKKGLSCTEISKKLDVSINTVKSWRKRYWTQGADAPAKRTLHPEDAPAAPDPETRPKQGAPPGNVNAVGAGAPKGNRNAVKHGGWSELMFRSWTEEHRQLLDACDEDVDAEELLINELKLLTAREGYLLERISHYSKEGAYVQTQTTSKRSRNFKRLDGDTEKEKNDLQAYVDAIDAKVAAGERLPGNETLTNSTLEASYLIIERLNKLLTDVQRQKAQCIKQLAELRNMSGGGKSELVDDWVAAIQAAEGMRDMDMTEGRRFLRDAVLEHFGVPREIMGITESSNRATSEAAQYIYAQNVIMPRLNRREEAINTQILPFYEILQEYEIQTRSRARLIADQETVMTLETGHYDMMQKSGATTKTWHHRPQKNPRDGSNGGPNHVKMDGETVPIDARFSNGLRYPCDPEGPARETIKCRCYVTYNR